MNDDLIPPMEDEDLCLQLGHEWLRMVDQYGVEMMTCERCDTVMVTAPNG